MEQGERLEEQGEVVEHQELRWVEEVGEALLGAQEEPQVLLIHQKAEPREVKVAQ